ncbi:Uncharacterised protein [Mycobacteroides abscessus subsp. abscessus]|nr:Uncharacterised protein [Mycobacteroides abscessus subsp. abscessus]
MKYISSDKRTITIEVPIDEMRAVLDILNEFRNGPYAITDDEWAEVMLQPREVESKILSDLDAIFDAYEAEFPDEKTEL